jgi:hypothetical protein
MHVTWLTVQPRCGVVRSLVVVVLGWVGSLVGLLGGLVSLLLVGSCS